MRQPYRCRHCGRPMVPANASYAQAATTSINDVVHVIHKARGYCRSCYKHHALPGARPPVRTITDLQATRYRLDPHDICRRCNTGLIRAYEGGKAVGTCRWRGQLYRPHGGRNLCHSCAQHVRTTGRITDYPPTRSRLPDADELQFLLDAGETVPLLADRFRVKEEAIERALLRDREPAS